MNRAQRRALMRSAYAVHWRVAVSLCPDCDAPICPDCGDHTATCDCCGEFNCDRCGVYVTPPVPRAR